jgi:hypothetical protein
VRAQCVCARARIAQTLAGRRKVALLCGFALAAPADLRARARARTVAVRVRATLPAACSAENRPIVEALLQSVRESPPHSAPKTARMRRRVAHDGSDDTLVWGELKLYSDVRSSCMRARARAHLHRSFVR